MKNKGYSVLALAVCLLACIGWGQSTFATITGIVADPTGAVIPGASIAAKHVQKNYQYNVTSNEAGQYTLANLPEGTYALVVKASGFEDFKVDSVIVAVRENRRIDARMSVAGTGTTVEVTAGAALIETESARISDTRDHATLRAMPLTMRRTWDFVTLSPQVDRTSGSWQIKFAGSKESQGDTQLDGTTLTASSTTPIGPLMDRTEAVQEMRVDIAASAEFASVGQITMVSRSGSNQLRGSVSDYYETPAFRARSPFQLTKDSQRLHTLAFAIGGPIYLPRLYNGVNRTFFFTTLEMAAGSASGTSFNRGVPLESWRNGEFANAGLAIKDPFNGNTPFPDNRIPQSRLNPVAVALQDMFIPLPNYGDPNVWERNNYRELRTGHFSHQPNLTNRIDHRISDKAFVFGRWTMVRWNQDYYGTGQAKVNELTYSRRNMDAFTGALTQTITSNLLNEVRYGMTTQRIPTWGFIKGKEMVETLKLQGLAPDLPDVYGIPAVSFSGLSIGGFSTKGTCNPCNEEYGHSFTDNLSWMRGKHSIKIGMNVRQGSYSQLDYGNVFGTTAYSGRFTGQPYADFMLGIPTTMSRDYPGIYASTSRRSQGYYITDEWRPTPLLTVTLGMRWDLYSPATEANNRMATFDVGTRSIVVADGSRSLVSPLMPAGYVGIKEASEVGLPARSLVISDKNNFQPRIGIAYRPWGANTVLRGGAGIYYNQTPAGVASGSTVPFVITQPSYTNSTTNPYVLPVVFPPSGTSGPASVSLPGAGNWDLAVPYSIQYSATIEHQRWETGFRISYTGLRMNQGLYSRNINQPVADERLFTEKPRLFPEYPNLYYTENGTSHQYHGLTLQAQRRMKGGLQYQSYWTWARDIEDGGPEDAYNRLRERAVAGDTPTHRFASSVVYELPFGKGRPWGSDAHWLMRGIFGGWQVSSIATLESGRFISASWTGPDPTGTRFTQTATRPVVTLRPDQIADADISNPTVDRWFNVEAFAAPAIGSFGSAGRNTIRGTPTQVLHSSVAKVFSLGERLRLKTELIATNALNHPNYTNPNTTITAIGSAGTINSVVDRNTKMDSAIPRVLQFHMRLEW